MGRERILVDTSFLVAWLNKKDIHHKKAFQVKNELGSKAVLVITDVVVNETLSVLNFIFILFLTGMKLFP